MSHPIHSRIRRAVSRGSAPLEVSGSGRGTVLFGGYRLHEKLGDGGFAQVFLARRDGAADDPDLVLKRLHPHLAEDPESVDMFLTEARLMAELDHPGIVRIYTLEQIESQWSIVMERVDGGSLGDLFECARRQRQPLPLASAVYVVRAVAEALHHAHGLRSPETGCGMGVIHRDVKPDNILISWDGAVKITDFGCAKAAIQSEHTRPGIRKGTLDYMSPEQCLGRPLDPRSDIFSLGVVLYELATGKRLYDDAGDARVMERIAHEVTRPPSWDNPEIDPSLDLILLRALEKDPEDRFETAGDLARSLQWWLDRYVHGDPREDLATWMREHFSGGAPATARFRPQVRERSGGQLALRRASPPSPEGSDSHRAAETGPGPGESPTVAPERFAALQSIVARNSNLPPETGPLIGRRAELGALDEALSGRVQLVSLHGPAGIGKSRLADAWARGRLDSPETRSGGVWLCDLGSATDAHTLRTVLARVLGLASGASEGAEQIGHALAVRGSTVLVLDGRERLDAECEELLTRWCRGAPELEVVVATRQPLETLDAICIRVPPLSLPTRPAVIAESESVQLLLATARSADPGFSLHPGNALAVFDLVHEMRGNPQAIELAAARLPRELETGGLGHLASLVQQRLKEPHGPMAAETLQAAVSWSWERLDALQRDVLAQATVFSGGFTAQAAMAVLLPDLVEDRQQILTLLEGLRERSLLRATEMGEQPGRLRYQVVSIARPLARAHLLAGDRPGRILQRHADHFLWLAEHIAPLCFMGEGSRYLATLRVEQDNLAAIWRRALRVQPSTAKSAARALRAALALTPYAVVRGGHQSWLGQLDAALDAARATRIAPELRALGLLERATALRHLGREPEAVRALAAAERLSTEADDAALLARVELSLGDLALRADTPGAARKRFRRAVALLDGTDQAAYLAYAYMGMGRAARAEGRLETAESCQVAARRLYHQVGHWHGEAVATSELGAVRLDLGRAAQAEADLRLAMAALRSFGDRRRRASTLIDLGRLAVAAGDPEAAGRHFVQALELARQLASPRLEARARGEIARLPALG